MISVKVLPQWESFVDGVAGTGRTVQDDGSARFRQAAEMMFSMTQTYVHVLSGDLISTGEVIFEQGDGLFQATISYGGKPGAATGRMVDYAEYEIARGGSHDFLGRAMDDVEAVFGSSISTVIDEVIRRWN